MFDRLPFALFALVVCGLSCSPNASAQGVPALNDCLARLNEEPPLLLASCITGRVASQGHRARDAGPGLLNLAREQDGLVRAAAISALGRIGFDDATQFVGESLNSSDWRVALAAARSIGWLGGVGYVDRLRVLARSHWLREVRTHAQISIEALQSPQRRRFVESDLRPGHLYIGPMIGAEGISIGNATACPSQRWHWNGVSFRAPSTPRMTLPFAGGTLAGSDAGEWGGQLTWIASHGEVTEVYDDNVHGIEPAGENAIAAVGLAHLSLDDGSVLLVQPTTPPSATMLLVLPGAPDGLATVVADEVFVAWSHGYAIVFNLNGIMGVAPCAP